MNVTECLQKETSGRFEYDHIQRWGKFLTGLSFYFDCFIAFTQALVGWVFFLHFIFAVLAWISWSLWRQIRTSPDASHSHIWQICAVSNWACWCADCLLTVCFLLYSNAVDVCLHVCVWACVCVFGGDVCVYWLAQCVVSSNLNCCSSESHCACMYVCGCAGVCDRQETARSCWVTMATGWAAMTDIC